MVRPIWYGVIHLVQLSTFPPYSMSFLVHHIPCHSVRFISAIQRKAHAVQCRHNVCMEQMLEIGRKSAPSAGRLQQRVVVQRGQLHAGVRLEHRGTVLGQPIMAFPHTEPMPHDSWATHRGISSTHLSLCIAMLQRGIFWMCLREGGASCSKHV